jgi:non-ribosomal peptide synthetase component F
MPEFSFTADDRFLQMFDLTFDLSIMSMLTPLLVGASAHVPPAKGAGYLSVQRTLDRERVTVALMVPSVLSFLQKYFNEIRLPDLRYSLFCGEALPASLARAWAACAPNARRFNVYGPTEATIFCTSYELPADRDAEAHHGVVSIGAPMPGMELIVLDENRAPVPAGKTGDLYLAGGQVTDRYWRNEEKTREAFGTISHLGEERFAYRTGDVAFERDGQFFYCGRSDQQVKIAGYRVELGEIEHQARRLPGITDAAAAAEADASGNCVVHLFVRRDVASDDALTGDVRAELASHLPSYMIPHKVQSVTAFPLNQNGKIDRRALLQTLAPRPTP